MDPTEEELKAALAQWQAADAALAGGQSYTIDGLMLTRVDAHQVKNKITYYRRQLIDLAVAAAGGQQGQRKPVWS
jgi:hypothetical protein